jgi:hypothetical protein
MKPRIAKISLAVAIVLFFGGFGMLCACPGFYVLAAVFAGVAACLSAGRMRVWSLVCTAVCLIGAGTDTLILIREHQKFKTSSTTLSTNDINKTNRVSH